MFTVEEANAILEQVIPLVEQLQSLRKSIIKAHEQIDEPVSHFQQGNGYPLRDVHSKLEELTKRQMLLIEAFRSTMQQLESLGGRLKDLDIGLVDFLSERDGEPILLCWKLGEERIRFWHSLESGFAGRQPLDEEQV